MRNTNREEYTRLQHDIFRVLCGTAGSKVNQRTLAAKLGVTPAAVSRALPAMAKDGTLLITPHGKMNLKEIELDRENRRIVQLKRAENLREIYRSGFADYLSEAYPGCTVLLFGSYARGEDTVRSDVDIAVIGAGEKKLELELFQGLLEREIRVTYLDSLGRTSKEFRESLLNGIVLAGAITL